MNLPQILIATLEQGFNRLLALDPEAAALMAEMEGRVICLHLQGLNVKVFIFPSIDDVMILDQFDAAADTTISGTPMALVKLGLADNKQAEMFSGDVTITGDLRLGRKFNRLFASIDIDWEEQLSKLVGDMAARGLGNLSRDLFSWYKRNHYSMQQNSGEYLQEEIQYLPSRNESDYILKKIDQFRDDVERFEARLNLLETNKNNQTDSKDSH